jgi:hypothetical protein
MAKLVVILDGALTSTVIGTLSYAEAAGQKVNCRPLAKGRKFMFCFGPEGGRVGRGETDQLCTGERRLSDPVQYVPLAAVCSEAILAYKSACAWVKGQGTRGNEEPKWEERLNIEAAALCDAIRFESSGPLVAKGNCPMWDIEVCVFYVQATKVTSNMKVQLQWQIHDKDLRKYLIEREVWTESQYAWDWRDRLDLGKTSGTSR